MLATIFLWFNFITFEESNYKVKHYTIRDGLTSNQVYSITKDNQGRYWIATNGGLQMYDGYKYRSYNSSKEIIKDILGVKYYNKYLYINNINKIQIIPISSIYNNINSRTYNFELTNCINQHYLNGNLYVLYKNYYDLYSNGYKKKRVSVLKPYFDYEKNKIKSLDSSVFNRHNKYLFLYRQLENLKYAIVYDSTNDAQGFLAVINNSQVKIIKVIKHEHMFNYSHFKDSIFYYFNNESNSVYFSDLKTTRNLFKDLKVNSVNEFEKSVFFLTTNNGLIQYNEKTHTIINAQHFNYLKTQNWIFKAEKLNLYNEYFSYRFKNNYLTEIQTDKILFSDSYVNYINWNHNIKSHYVLNDSLIILGYRKGQNTILYNYKTRKIKKEYDPVWVKKVRAEDENNLFILTYDDFRIYKNGVKKVYQLKYKGNYVLTNDLLRSGSRYIYGTNDQGVFISDTNFKFQKHYHQTNGLQSNLIHQLKESGGAQLWLRSEKGIDRILQNGKVEHIFAFDEIEDYDIKDFTASQDSLWVFTEKNVYALEYKSRLNPGKIPLVWHNLTVNDTQNFYPIDSNITIGPSWEKLKIEYAGIYLEDQSNIRYRYRIVHNGDTANWIETDQISFVSSSFAPGDYVFQLQAYHQIYPNTCSEIKNITFHIKPYFYQTWWFYGLVLFGSILAALSILYYRNKLKMRTLQAEAELHKTTLHGLQTQMNPHFVFNAMNTLQHFILEKDLESSLKYLNEFSSLIRTILDNSSQFEIFLKDEIQFLKKYIDVESKRFENQFTSEILVHVDDTDLQDIKIPPMLIQPLVENAIKHGMPTAVEGKATIRIEFNMDSDTKLDIKIIDNGNREINADNSKSKAINILKERIALIEKRGEKASFHLYRERSETIAHLILPI